MARIRTIKPQFWRSPDVMQLTHFERLLYIGLWNLADDEGRGAYEPHSIAADIFLREFSLSPHGVVTEVSNAFSTYQQLGMVVIYGREGRQYYQIIKWADHQKINRPGKSKIPPPARENVILDGFTEDSLSPHAQLTEAAGRNQGGLTVGIRNKEGKEFSENSLNPTDGDPVPEPKDPPSLDELSGDFRRQEKGPGVYGTPEDARCAEHKGLPPGEAPRCPNCARARQWFTHHADDEKRTHAQERRAAIDACGICDEAGWVSTPAGVVRCNHESEPPRVEAPTKEERDGLDADLLARLQAQTPKPTTGPF